MLQAGCAAARRAGIGGALEVPYKTGMMPATGVSIDDYETDGFCFGGRSQH